MSGQSGKKEQFMLPNFLQLLHRLDICHSVKVPAILLTQRQDILLLCFSKVLQILGGEAHRRHGIQKLKPILCDDVEHLMIVVMEVFAKALVALIVPLLEIDVNEQSSAIGRHEAENGCEPT